MDTALFAVRIRTHRSHGQPPFFLTYGVEPHLLGDDAPPLLQDSSSSNPRIQAEVRTKRLEELGRLREAATKRAEMVLVRLETKYGLVLNWFGPFLVFQRNLTSGLCKLIYLNGAPYQSWFHADRLLNLSRTTLNAPWFQPAPVHTPLRSVPRTLAALSGQS